MMLQLPETSPVTAALSRTETPISRIMRLLEEVVTKIVLEEDKRDCDYTIVSALYERHAALCEEASCRVPQTVCEAVFLLLLAGSKSDLILNGRTRRIKTINAECQISLIGAALQFFQEHKESFPIAWDYLAVPISRIRGVN